MKNIVLGTAAAFAAVLIGGGATDPRTLSQFLLVCARTPAT
jgi:hypothetical protein